MPHAPLTCSGTRHTDMSVCLSGYLDEGILLKFSRNILPQDRRVGQASKQQESTASHPRRPCCLQSLPWQTQIQHKWLLWGRLLWDPAFFSLIACFAYCSTLKREAVCSSEISGFYELRDNKTRSRKSYESRPVFSAANLRDLRKIIIIIQVKLR